MNIFGQKTENFSFNPSTSKRLIKLRPVGLINWELLCLPVLLAEILYSFINPVNIDSVPNAVLPIPSNGLIKCFPGSSILSIFMLSPLFLNPFVSLLK